MKSFVLFLFSVARSFFDAFVVWKLWGWFVQPLGAPAITYWHAYGIGVILGVMRIPVLAMVYARTEYGDSYETNVRAFSATLVGYASSLLVGFLVHLVMTQ